MKLLTGLLAGFLAVAAAHGQPNTIVNFKVKVAGTTIGELNVELFNQEKPATVRNFLRYLQSGLYGNVILHRCVSNFVVQGGGFSIANPADPNAFTSYAAVGLFPAVTNEFLTGPMRSNSFGTLAMAKNSGNPDSATSQWFFNLAQNAVLDTTNNNGGFTVFGRLLSQTNYQNGTSNLLEIFRTRSLFNGITDLTVFYGADAAVFSELPVNYLGLSAPTYRDLFTVEITAPNAPDAVPPIVNVTVPSQNQRVGISNFTASGTAADDVGVQRVEFRLNGGAWANCVGTNAWTASTVLLPGTSTLEFRSVDAAGNMSDIRSRNVILDTNSFQGTYNGLFYETSVVAHQSSGAFSLALSANRSYTATLTLAGLTYKLKGQLGADLKGTNTFAASGGASVRVEWEVNPAAGTIAGVVTDGNWTSPLTGNRVVFSVANQTPLAGSYTLLIPGSSNSAAAPGGTSFASVTLSTSGLATLKGTLADGTAISQSIGIAADGNWPFYVSLFKGQGSVFGWLTFTNLPQSDLVGTVNWFKKSTAGGKNYTGGFSNLSVVDGARYTIKSPSLTFTNGFLVLTGAGVGTSSNSITLGPGDRVANISANVLSVKLTGAKATFSGSYTLPGTKTKVSFTGMLHQKSNQGAGFFLNGAQSGNVYFGP